MNILRYGQRFTGASILMAGKGSKPRPLAVSQNKFDKQWDLIFGGKNMKHQEHKRNVSITEKVSSYWSDNGKREAVVNNTNLGYEVDLYEQSRFIRTVDCHTKSVNWAEDVAENWALGVLN